MEDDGYNSMKEAYDQEMALMDSLAKSNPDAMLGWIKGELAGGKFLVLPESLYDQTIPFLEKQGWTKEDYKNIYRSEHLKVVSS
jgi:hypothetical protein